MFHKEQKKAFKNNAFIAQNMYYNTEKDYFVCPIGQHMEKTGTGTRKSENGFVSNVTYYEAGNCSNCPLKCLCSKAQGNRRIEINYKLNAYRKNARDHLTSQEGLLHRSRRPIEPEAVFGQIKANRQYNRFRHSGKDKVKMDFAIFAIAFNLGKLANKRAKIPKNGQNQYHNKKKSKIYRLIFIFSAKNCSDEIFHRKCAA
jgi:hypothetical protein